MLDKREFYIGGEWVGPRAGTSLEVIDPSTEEPCAVISLGGQADTDAAVAAATFALDDWSQSDKATRLALIRRIAEEYDRRAEDMAQAISLEMGAPIDFAHAQQAAAGSGHIADFIVALEGYDFDTPLGPQAPGTRILRDPVGVCALITPWNWPMNQVTLKVIPALAAGCTMVLKPSEIAPLSSMVFAEIMHDAGVPAGVFNLVNGDGAGVGSQLSAHPGIDMVSFTGSTRAGRAISIAAADTIKKVTLELGGKGANIVFDDATTNAIKLSARRVFNNSGQSCNAPTRMLVQRSRYDEAVEIARTTAEALRVGPASQPGKHIGPVVSQVQFDKIQGLIEAGMAEGARLVAGGPGRPEGLNRGYFVRPTVFADVTNDMTIAQQEIFGPVLSILPFESEEDAIRIANDTVYGLTNYIQTQGLERGHRVARRMRTGMVELNHKSLGSGSPFGGVRQSGNGREGGVFGIEEFLEIKAVSDWAEA
jgi:aldehyde dehydrogenase (NAD+)